MDCEQANLTSNFLENPETFGGGCGCPAFNMSPMDESGGATSGSAAKRLCTEMETDNGIDGASNTKPASKSLPTADEVKRLMDSLHDDRMELLSWLTSERQSDRKDKLRSAVNSLFGAVNTLGYSYIAKLCVEEACGSCSDSLNRACSNIEKSTASLSGILLSRAATVNTPVTSNNNNRSSFANVASHGSFADSVKRAGASCANKVFINHGKPLNVETSKRVVIGIKEGFDGNFATPDALKSKVLEVINPREIQLRANGVFATKKNTVIIDAVSVDEAKLAANLESCNAGLEIQPSTKMKPRMIVRAVPTSLTKEYIKECLISQNLSNAQPDDVSVVYLYPAGDKDYRSVVIEVNADQRQTLYSRGRVFLDAYSCFVGDHVVAHQCFNCHDFKHIAKDCTNATICGRCSGNHKTAECKKENVLCCINCKNSQSRSVNGTAHAAFDKAKCPILRSKLQQKIRLIDYGA